VWRTGIGDMVALNGVSMEAEPRDRGAIDIHGFPGRRFLCCGSPGSELPGTRLPKYALSALGFPRCSCLDPVSLWIRPPWIQLPWVRSSATERLTSPTRGRTVLKIFSIAYKTYYCMYYTAYKYGCPLQKSCLA